MTDPELAERDQLQREHEAELGAQSASMQAATSRLAETHQNPEFFDKLSDSGLGELQKYGWTKEELGLLFATPNFVAERSEEYEREAALLTPNRVERKAVQHSPGRLTKKLELQINGETRYPILEIAQRVHNRRDKDVREEMHPDDIQALRLTGVAAANYHSNAVGGAGRRTVGEATAVSKVERNETEESGIRSRAKGLLSH